MTFLRGSANYVWITTNVLGKGATAAVFQGVNKNNGEPVAVKTFNQMGHARDPDVQLREFEVIQRVNHENIVKLLAIEEDQEGRGKVIVMELCTGGSLFTILDDPENTYGLQEEEFLLVLEHLTAGMKHLRDNNLVHRDLKPGNIMKFIADDGRTIYKLTDFGAARELQEDQQFMSLYGTEEYLHPDLYERAVLRKPVGKAFGATVDLWSIGVTLYHVATGNLPFRPFGGRRNKETMYHITTKKASGVISGIQLKENGPIEWSRELPNACRLSAGLKKLVIPLLAGLMEADTQRVWSFDGFFSEVMNILSRKLLHIFFLNRAQSIRIYLHSEGTYEELQSLVRDQTAVKPMNQIMLLKDAPLSSLVEDSTPGRSYPTTEETNPIMLMSKDNNDVIPAPENDLPDFPVFQSQVSVENDASIAKLACSVGHECKRRIEKLARTSRLNHLCVRVVSAVRVKDLERVLARSNKLQELILITEEVVAAVTRCRHIIRELNVSAGREQMFDGSEWQSELEAWQNESKDLKKLTGEVAPALQQLHQRYVTERSLLQQWTTATREVPCPAESRIPNKARTHVERLRDSWQHLLRDRATRSLSYNEEQFHVLERMKVSETGRQLKLLLEQDTAPHLAQQAECIADWYKIAQTLFTKTQILEKDISEYERRLDSFLCCITGADRIFQEDFMIKLLAQRDEERRQKPASQRPALSKEDVSTLRLRVKEAVRTQKDIVSVVEENSSLMMNMTELIKTLPIQGSDLW